MTAKQAAERARIRAEREAVELARQERAEAFWRAVEQPVAPVLAWPRKEAR